MDTLAIQAVQDIGCLSAAKFFYQFPDPISYEVIEAFDDCAIIARKFSKTIQSAKDLVAVKRPEEFAASFVIGAHRAVVYFDGSALNLPWAAIGAFERRLRAKGYGRILHSTGPRRPCGRCPVGILNRCDMRNRD